MPRISIKGVIAGGITDIFSTFLVSLPLMAIVMRGLVKEQVPTDKIMAMATSVIKSNLWYCSYSYLAGSICSILGGYVAARIAKQNEILNGALASFLCVSSGIYAIVYGPDTAPLWQHLLAIILSPLLAATGGYLRMRQTANLK